MTLFPKPNNTVPAWNELWIETRKTNLTL
ncbi:MAG: hypothetical protein LBD34_00355 [Puniceicoccales bacterium]|nr:hypothetical protein [Puniceicoccales bacterium]